MRKFGCGMLAMLGLLGAGLGIWFSLSEQSKGIIVGLVIGAVGMLIGIAFALAIVAILLLQNLRWQVQGSQSQAPVLMGYPTQYQLAPPGDADWSDHPPPATPSWNRPNRGFRIIGGSDAPSQGPPGTWPM